MHVPARTSTRAFATLAVALFLALAASPLYATAADPGTPEPQWTTTGTRWERASDAALPEGEAERFVTLWTARFLASEELDRYLNSEEVYADGFDAFPTEAKLHLVLRLLDHWQTTLPEFGRDVWTGDAAKDQETFEELAALLYAVIFEKDAFVGALRSIASDMPAPPIGEDQGDDIPGYPGLSQAEIGELVESIHRTNMRARPAPVPDVELDAHVPPPPPVVNATPSATPPRVQVPDLIAEALRAPAGLNMALPNDPEKIVNRLSEPIGAGLYHACGALAGGEITCGRGPSPIGTPVALDLDRDPLTGVGGAEVLVHLTPTVNPEFPAGFAASLSVRRTEPSTLPTTAPLPAIVYVAYRPPNAPMQVRAGFDARDGTLGDVQEARVTLKDTLAALADDVGLRAEVTRAGPGDRLSLVAGFSPVNVDELYFYDPTDADVKFIPAPDAFRVDLRFTKEGERTVIEGGVNATESPTIVAKVTSRRGWSLRTIDAVLESVPQEIAFRAVSEAVGATRLSYEASAPFPRVAIHDELRPDTRTPERKTLDAEIRGIPASINFTIERPFKVSYDASSRVQSASVGVASYDAHGLVQAVGALVAGIPKTWSVTGTGNPFSVVYDADGPIDVIAAGFADRALQLSGGVGVYGAPSDWRLDLDDGLTRFTSESGVGAVQGEVKKRDAVAETPIHFANYLVVTYVESPDGNDHVAAKFRMTSVQGVEHKRDGADTVLELRMGGGLPFRVVGDLSFLTGERAYAAVTLSPLPSFIRVTLGEKTTVTTNANIDLAAYAMYGTHAALAATPEPRTHHGVSVRDGRSGAARALKAHVWLTGLPTSVTIDPRANAFSFDNWRPSQSAMHADVELDDFVSPSIDAWATLEGLSGPQSLAFSMRAGVEPNDVKATRADLVLARPMGRVWAEANVGGNVGFLEISNVPDDVHVAYLAQRGLSHVIWDANTPISLAMVGFRVASQSVDLEGYVKVTDIPSDFSISLGRDPSGRGPTLWYRSNANTLDVEAAATASLFGGDARARLSFVLTNLGQSVDVFASGSGVRFVSVPATERLYASVWGTYSHFQEGSGIWDEGGFVEFPWAYHIGVTPTVNDLSVTLTNFRDFSLEWGVTTKISGVYSQFRFGWGSMSVWLDLYGHFAIRVDWPWPFGKSYIRLVDVHEHHTVPVNVLFHKYDGHEGFWFSRSGTTICDWEIGATIGPHPHGTQWNGVDLASREAAGGTWYVTPNPFNLVPHLAVDLAARFTAPGGGSGPGIGFDFDC